MKRHELIEKIEEIQNRNYAKFKGSNEADLMCREEIADLIFSQFNREIPSEAELKTIFNEHCKVSTLDEDTIKELETSLLGNPNLDWDYMEFEDFKNAVQALTSSVSQNNAVNLLKPILVERFADNGEHSHWTLIDPKTSDILWNQKEQSEV